MEDDVATAPAAKTKREREEAALTLRHKTTAQREQAPTRGALPGEALRLLDQHAAHELRAGRGADAMLLARQAQRMQARRMQAPQAHERSKSHRDHPRQQPARASWPTGPHERTPRRACLSACWSARRNEGTALTPWAGGGCARRQLSCVLRARLSPLRRLCSQHVRVRVRQRERLRGQCGVLADRRGEPRRRIEV
eukprot:2806281-Prymnesium_polylepis.2